MSGIRTAVPVNRRLDTAVQLITQTTKALRDADTREVERDDVTRTVAAALDLARVGMRHLERLVDAAPEDDLMAIAQALQVERFGGGPGRRHR